MLGLWVAACAGNAGDGDNRDVGVTASALTSSVTVTATKVGNIRRTGCGVFSHNMGQTDVGGNGSCSSSADVFRNYFIFNLGGIQNASTATPTSATFSTQGGNNAGSYSRTITFRSYTGDPSSGTLATNWGNLITGTSYGTVTVTSSSNPNPATFGLNAAGLTAVQGVLGSGNLTLAGGYSSEANGQYAIDRAPALSSVTLALSLTCNNGYGDCNGGTDGCERNLNANATCGTTCTTTACTTSQTCTAGACVACSAGTSDCDGNSANGCEKTNTDASCGCAGTACTTAQTCTAGACTACAAGTRDCDGSAANGCEKPINTDASCGTTCTTSACTTAQTCTAGACVACAAGLRDCDASAANGCEKVINSATSCGTSCTTVSCNDSNVCSVDSCSAGACVNAAGNAGTVCRASAGVCDPVAEQCTGSSTVCPTDAVAPSTTVCRNQTNICDATEYCTGTSNTCPGDGSAPMGDACGYSTGGTTIYSSGTPGNAVDSTSGFSSQTLTNAGPTTAWSDALRFTATADSTGNGAVYWRFSTAARTFLATDYIEYDVYLTDERDGLGGIDVGTASGYLRNAPSTGVGPAVDQAGVSSHPSSDISESAYGRWYHRRLALNGLSIVGKTSTKWVVADEYDFPNATSTAYYDNVIVAVKPGACDGANVCKVKSGAACSAASECASGICTGSVCVSANGVACTAGTQCSSGNCVDDVCCNTTCAGGTSDCQACSIAAGAATDGTCGTVTAASATVCRASVDSCDPVETCAGSSTACPADIN